MGATEEIVSQLRRDYRPVGVLLHGSRAVGMDRPHSDWDLLLLFNEMPEGTVKREEIAGEDVEWSAVRVPLADEAILRTVGIELQHGKVLWEDDSRAGTRLLEQAAAFYRRGVSLTQEDRRMYKQYLSHKVAGMEDDIATPYLFLRHQYAFFLRASNWWFELRGLYPQPFYLAMPFIGDLDPESHRLLMTICSAETNEAKLSAARSLVSRLFP